MGRPTKIIVNLKALAHNLQQIRKLAPHSLVLAMVKSNAYGHGIERIGLALSQQADALGVACIEEGMMLRTAGIKTPIVLMEGLFTNDELIKAANEDFTLIVHHEAQVQMFERNPTVKPLSIWIKIDTGMHRLGFPPSEFASVYERLLACQSVNKPMGLMTHFAEADSSDRTPVLRQIDLFNQITANFPGPRSLANSAGIIAWPNVHADWVRPGIMLYGASPFLKHSGMEYELQPVMSLVSEIIAIHDIKPGERIGYGGTFVTPEPMRVGVVGIGYGDGYPQCAKNGTPILVNGQLCPLVGRVSMDMLTVDLRTQPTAKVGDPVVLWGPQLPVENVALHNHTSAYELLTRITQRVHVVVV